LGGAFRFLVFPAIKLKAYFEEQRLVSELDTSVIRKIRVVRVGLGASQWVRLLNKGSAMISPRRQKAE
jgi:hypothetical protein